MLLLERDSGSGARGREAIGVVEKLRLALIRFAGMDGFAALMRRAMALAKKRIESLEAVKVNPDGTLEGFDEFAAASGDSADKGAVEIISQLLALLVTFIGKPLTLRLLREAWPDASLTDASLDP